MKQNNSGAQDQEEEQTYIGPSLPPAQNKGPNPYTSLRVSETYALVRGQASYSEVLYARYTPCGEIFEEMKPLIISVNEARRTKKPRLDPNSPLVHKFRDCIARHQEFYDKREQSLKDFKKSAMSF